MYIYDITKQENIKNYLLVIITMNRLAVHLPKQQKLKLQSFNHHNGLTGCTCTKTKIKTSIIQSPQWTFTKTTKN